MCSLAVFIATQLHSCSPPSFVRAWSACLADCWCAQGPLLLFAEGVSEPVQVRSATLAACTAWFCSARLPALVLLCVSCYSLAPLIHATDSIAAAPHSFDWPAQVTLPRSDAADASFASDPSQTLTVRLAKGPLFAGAFRLQCLACLCPAIDGERERADVAGGLLLVVGCVTRIVCGALAFHSRPSASQLSSARADI